MGKRFYVALSLNYWSGRFMHGFRLRRKWFLVSKHAKVFVVMVRDTFKEKNCSFNKEQKNGFNDSHFHCALSILSLSKKEVLVERFVAQRNTSFVRCVRAEPSC